MSSFVISRVSSAAVTAAAAVYLALGTPAAAELVGGARVTLLPAGIRASVVVELDGESPMATAIEATDNQTVAVEIGPVRGKVVNQILHAAESSPLVKQVRVRGLTQGIDGTVLTILIEAKIPVSGSVRRATRRVYIDLEPRDVLSAGARTTTRTPSVDDPGRPTPTSSPKPETAPVRPTPPVALPPPLRSPAPGGNAPTTAIADAGSVRPPSVPPVEPARTPAASAARATAPATPPAVSAGPPPAPAPVAASPSTAVTASPTATAPSSTATTAATGSLNDIQRRAEQLTRIPDVKALQQLKAEVIARRDSLGSVGAPTADVTGLLARFDQYVTEAQRNQLALDGSLFRGGQAPPSTVRASATPQPEPATPPRAQTQAQGPPPTAQMAIAPSAEPIDRPAQLQTLPPAQNEAPPAAMARAGAQASTPQAAGSTASSVRSPASQATATPALSIPAFRQALKPIKPDLESVAVALGSWSGGALPPANLQGVVASLIARLRAIQPPTEIAWAHAGMCTALDALAIMWAKAMVEAPPEGTEHAVIERARSAVDEFIRVEGTLAPTTAAR